MNFYLIFHWSLFTMVEFNNNQALVQIRLGAKQAPSLIWTNDGLIYWRIYVSLRLARLTLAEDKLMHLIPWTLSVVVSRNQFSPWHLIMSSCNNSSSFNGLHYKSLVKFGKLSWLYHIKHWNIISLYCILPSNGNNNDKDHCPIINIIGINSLRPSDAFMCQ